jgi:hypothetical protein
MKTVSDVALDAGDAMFQWDHVFGWIATMRDDPSIRIYAEWPQAPNSAGDYVVTITARDVT